MKKFAAEIVCFLLGMGAAWLLIRFFELTR